MKELAINLKTPIQGLSELKFSLFKLNEDKSLTIRLVNEKDVIGLFKNQTLVFRRFFNTSYGLESVSGYSTILDIHGSDIIITEPLAHIFKITEVKNSILIPNKKIVKVDKNHNVFLQDINKQKLYFHDINGVKLDGVYSFEIIFKREDIIATSGDCLTNSYVLNKCNNCENNVKYYEYQYLPEKFSRDSIAVSNVPDNAYFLSFKYNPFYYVDEYNVCHLWEDEIWANYEISNIANDCQQYKNNFDNKVVFGKDESYWGVNMFLSSDSNENKLGSEDSFNEYFTDNIVNDLIPEVVDMERLKYSPVIIDNDSNDMTIATSITMDFHFRERKEINDSERYLNTSFTSGNVYYDSWNIDIDNETKIWWNGYNNDETEFNSGIFKKFYNESGKTSDLVGYLNFTDDDIFYKKKKVSKSFIRLSFYNSKDPIEQKLLYYSTIFLDGGTLYGKYLKQLIAINNNEILLKEPKNEKCKVVFTQDGPSPVDTEIVITNEFDRTKSSEGFNLYLFSQDREFIKDIDSEKTLYMKVEFNHAGNGKTIPMIMWPQSSTGNFLPLTMDNFIDNLYIPVKLKYINGSYVYFIPGADNVDGNISLILFEPKLDLLSDNNTYSLKYKTYNIDTLMNYLDGEIYINEGVTILDKLPETYQEGYEFKGWMYKYEDENDTVKTDVLTDDIRMTDNIKEVYGNYEIKKHVVVCSLVGSNKNFSKTYQYGTSMAIIKSDIEVNFGINGILSYTDGQIVKDSDILMSDLNLLYELDIEKFVLKWTTTGIVNSGIVKVPIGAVILDYLPTISGIETYNFNGWFNAVTNEPIGENQTMISDLEVVGNYTINGVPVIIQDNVNNKRIEIQAIIGDSLTRVIYTNQEFINYQKELNSIGYDSKIVDATGNDIDSRTYIEDKEGGYFVYIERIPQEFVITWSTKKINRNENLEIVDYTDIQNGKVNIKVGDDIVKTLEKFTKYVINGYDFTSWYDETGNKLEDSTTMTNRNMTVVGYYDISRYNVTIFENKTKIFGPKEYMHGTLLSVVLNDNELKTVENNLYGYHYTYYLNENMSTTVQPNLPLTNDLDLFAKREPNPYNVTFIGYKDNEQYRNEGPKEVLFETVIPFPNFNDVEGYDFSWDKTDYVSNDNRLIKVPEADTGLTITGVYTIKSYNVVVNMDGKTIYNETLNHFTKLSTVLDAIKPKLDEQYEAGWETKVMYNGKVVNPSDEVKSDMVITVEKTPRTYYIDLMVDGNLYKDNVAIKFQQKISEVINLIEKPTKEDYDFIKWCYEDGSDINNDTMPNHNITLVANFKKVVYIVYYKHAYSSSKGTEFTNDFNSFKLHIEENILNALNKVNGNKIGYTFVSWNYLTDDKLGKQINTNEVMPENDIYVSSNYQINTHDLVFIGFGYGVNNELPINPNYKEGETEYRYIIKDVEYGTNINQFVPDLSNVEIEGYRNDEYKWYVSDNSTSNKKGDNLKPETTMPDYLTFVKTYYEREKYKLSWTNIENNVQLSGSIDVYYGDLIYSLLPKWDTDNPLYNSDYEFSGWYYPNAEGGLGVKVDVEDTMPAKTVNVVCKLTKAIPQLYFYNNAKFGVSGENNDYRPYIGIFKNTYDKKYYEDELLLVLNPGDGQGSIDIEEGNNDIHIYGAIIEPVTDGVGPYSIVDKDGITRYYTKTHAKYQYICEHIDTLGEVRLQLPFIYNNEYMRFERGYKFTELTSANINVNDNEINTLSIRELLLDDVCYLNENGEEVIDLELINEDGHSGSFSKPIVFSRHETFDEYNVIYEFTTRGTTTLTLSDLKYKSYDETDEEKLQNPPLYILQKGSVDDFESLPSGLTSENIGYVYNVEESYNNIPEGDLNEEGEMYNPTACVYWFSNIESYGGGNVILQSEDSTPVIKNLHNIVGADLNKDEEGKVNNNKRWLMTLKVSDRQPIGSIWNGYN